MGNLWHIQASLIHSVARNSLHVIFQRISRNWVAWKDKCLIIISSNVLIPKWDQRIGKSIQVFLSKKNNCIYITLLPSLFIIFSFEFSVNAGMNVIKIFLRIAQLTALATANAQELVIVKHQKPISTLYFKRHSIKSIWATTNTNITFNN